jgi:2,3-bisphosphoglycerate-independent phosphoglycerate mutase
LKLIYVVIDGMGDLPIKELGNKTPLEAAETPNMDFLAKNGKTGLMYTVGKGIAPESDVAVISILGYDPFKYSTGRGVLEAVGAGLTVKEGDLALRCNFATMAQENKIVDRRAGRDLTTKEATALTKAVNNQVQLKSYPVNFEFKNTISHRGALVIRSREKPLSSEITNTDPAYSRLDGIGVAKIHVEMILKKSEPMIDIEEAKISAELVNEFVQKSHMVMDKHEVNKKRVAEGKLKANLILARDAGHRLPSFFNINDRYNVRFACLADMAIEIGISKLAGMYVIDLPSPTHDLEKDCAFRLKKLFGALPLFDCFYIHIKGPDEPGHDGKVQLKKKLITIIDKHFLGKLLPKIKLEDHVICVTADHATPCKLKAHSDDPVPILVSGGKIKSDGVVGFSERECKKGSLGVLENGTNLIPKLIGFVKS